MAAEAAAAQQRRRPDRAGGDDDQRGRDRTSRPRAARADRRWRDRSRSGPRLTRSPQTIRAPASQAWGRALRWTPPLALLGQPIAHWQAPRQPGALRRSGALCQSRAAAPSSASSPFRPSTSIGAGATPIVASTSATRGPSSSGLASAARAARARSLPPRWAGRKQVPELITVVPPTARPSGSAIGGLPGHRRAPVAVDAGEAVERVGVADPLHVPALALLDDHGVEPGRARARAAKAPPAPEPITIASQLLSRPLAAGQVHRLVGARGSWREPTAAISAA